MNDIQNIIQPEDSSSDYELIDQRKQNLETKPTNVMQIALKRLASGCLW